MGKKFPPLENDPQASPQVRDLPRLQPDYVEPVYPDLPFGWRFGGVEQFKQRCLPSPARAGQVEEFSFLHLQGNVKERLRAYVISLAYMDHLDHRG